MIEKSESSALFAPVEKIKLLPHYEVRVWQLAKSMGTQSKPVLRALRSLGRSVKSASSKIEMEGTEYEAFVTYFQAGWVE